jgi:hypothetical protein
MLERTLDYQGRYFLLRPDTLARPRTSVLDVNVLWRYGLVNCGACHVHCAT